MIPLRLRESTAGFKPARACCLQLLPAVPSRNLFFEHAVDLGMIRAFQFRFRVRP